MSYSLLIADDEEDILRRMEQYIAKHTTKFTSIYTAKNGAEAVELALRHRPDVMVLDVKMPIKSGMAVLRECRDAGVMTKTVILSGYDTFTYAQQAIRMGVVDYLLKPCRSSDLLQKLESLVDNTPAPAEENEGESPLVRRATAYCRENFHQSLTLNMVADYVGVSPVYLSKQFSLELGGFVEYLNGLRIRYACDYMRSSGMKLYEIAYAVGFSDQKYFSKVFKKVTGLSPSEYRRELEERGEVPL